MIIVQMPSEGDDEAWRRWQDALGIIQKDTALFSPHRWQANNVIFLDGHQNVTAIRFLLERLQAQGLEYKMYHVTELAPSVQQTFEPLS